MTCWDCESEMRPVVRPSTRIAWACDCGRVVLAEGLDEAIQWAAEVNYKGFWPIKMHRWEWEADE